MALPLPVARVPSIGSGSGADSHLTATTSSTRQGADVDLLASALHNALQSITPHTHHCQDSPTSRKDDKYNIEIIVDANVLTLRGTGTEVTPALLSGQVALNLTESTPVKQITLQFRGKAKLPPVENEMVSFNNSAMTYIVCNHEWSFLEGEKKHSHTLKAGRHLFPFQLNLGGSLPSSLYTSAHGGASIAYKLRAVATRPGFAHNLQAQRTITLLRSLSPESLEYQQSLELENTWPDKIMYFIMAPHKAWAAGDDFTAVVKFSPLAKGVRVLSVVTTLNETTKVHSRSGWQESTKPVITARHEFCNGQAVWVEHQDHRSRSGSGSSHHTGGRGLLSGPGPSGTFTPPSSTDYPRHPLPPSGRGMFSLPTWGSSPLGDPLVPQSAEDGPSTSTQSSFLNPEHDSESHMSEGDIATKLEISLPLCTTPSHSLEPVIITHRIRWVILISNPDGHTSELRCSLPLHILDYRLLDEAKAATERTRRLLLGGPEASEDHSPDLELPSYPSHIRDRIANMYLPDQAVLRVANPWIQQGISPVQLDTDQDGRHSEVTSGTHTPIEAQYVSIPTGHGDSDLEYVNSELRLSLSEHVSPPIESASPSRPASRRASRAPSRTQSRLPSPDRDREPSHQLRSRRSSSSVTGTHHGPEATATPSTYLHENTAASRNLHSLFHTTMKPLTSLTSSFASPRHYTHTPPPLSPHPHPRQAHGHGHAGTTTTAATGGPSAALPRTVPVTSHSLLHRAFTEVPDYGIASRGFLGGVTPLETLQGLPSYDEAEATAATTQRSRSESDLASMTTMTARPASRILLEPLLPLRPAPSSAAP